MKIGVLALQGSFVEHADALRRLGAEPVLVRLPDQLDGLCGLIIPGGESTSIGKLMVRYGLIERIKRMALAGVPIYGTCAGMILLAKDIGSLDQPLIGAMDIVVRRNAFGRQLDSFEEYLSIPVLGDGPFRGVFIRAPLVEGVGRGVRVLAELEGGAIVAVEEGNLLASAFHPELTDDLRMHEYFLHKASGVTR
ncbi:MAG: pyridoxal 5'-phosphate synthase glutaminase subunit PdxT [bacterium]